MGYVYRNNAISTLAAPIGAADTQVTVTTGEGALFPTPTGGDVFAVTLQDGDAGKMEICHCTTRAGDVLTVIRAREGTAAQTFAADSTTVSNRLTAASLLGVLESFSDAYHGARGGGALHAAATSAVAGFMSAADKTKLDGIATGGGEMGGAEILAELLLVDGAGSGLDADLLDGVQGADYARRNVIQEFTVNQTFSAELIVSGQFSMQNNTYGGRTARIFTDSVGNTYLRPVSSPNVFDSLRDFWYNLANQRWEFDAAAAPYVGINQIWHAGNDGPGSTLEADLLDGLHAASFGRIDQETIVPFTWWFEANPAIRATGPTLYLQDTDAAVNNKWAIFGHAVNNRLRFGFLDDGLAPGLTAFEIKRSGREVVSAEVGPVDAVAWWKATSAGVTILDNTAWHAGNDGAGSGLDADLLDGQHGAYYRDATNLNAGTLAVARLPSTVWTSANDGAGSLLDADLLDGLHASALLQLGGALQTVAKSVTLNGGNLLIVATASGSLEFQNASLQYGGRIDVGGAGKWRFTPAPSGGALNSLYELYFDTFDNNWKFGATNLIQMWVNNVNTALNDKQGVVLNGIGSITVQRPSSATGSTSLWQGYWGNTPTSNINSNGNFLSATNSYGALSDRRAKRNIQNVPSMWGSFKQLRFHEHQLLHEFDRMGEEAPVRIGLLTDELLEIPAFVRAVNPGGANEYASINYSDIYLKACAVIQELQARVEALEAR